MKLKVINNINEAGSISRGSRLLALEKINNIIEKAVIAANYRFKAQADANFYILPKNKQIVKISIDKKDNNEYKAQISSCIYNKAAKTIDQIQADTPEILNKVFNEQILPEALNLIFQISAEDINKFNLRNSVSEATPAFLQNIINNIKDGKDKKAASKYQQKLDKSKLKTSKIETENNKSRIDELLLDSTKKALEKINKSQEQAIKIKLERKDNHVDISFECDFILGALYETDTPNNQIKIKKCITAVSEIDLDCSLASFISLINRKLGVQIKISDASLLVATGSSKDAAEKIVKDTYESDLLTTLDDNILTALGENLNEALQDIGKYDNAFQLIGNDNEKGKNLVKLYFYRETAPKNIKLTEREAAELWYDIKKAGGFDILKAPLLGAFVTYYNKNNDSKNLDIELQNLITFLTTDNFIGRVEKIFEDPLLYNRKFIGAQLTSKDAQDIYSKYMNVIKKYKIPDKEKAVNIAKKIKDATAETVDLLTMDAKSLANYMVFDTATGKIRDTKTIASLYYIITGSSIEVYDDSEDGPTLTRKKYAPEIPTNAEGYKKIKEIFASIKIDGRTAMEIITKISNELENETAAKKFLAALAARVK